MFENTSELKWTAAYFPYLWMDNNIKGNLTEEFPLEVD